MNIFNAQSKGDGDIPRLPPPPNWTSMVASADDDQVDRRATLRARLGSIYRSLCAPEFINSLVQIEGAVHQADLLKTTITLIESEIYTADFVPRLISAGALTSYRLRLFDLAAIFGAGLGLAYLSPLVVFQVIVRGAGRLRGSKGRRNPEGEAEPNRGRQNGVRSSLQWAPWRLPWCREG